MKDRKKQILDTAILCVSKFGLAQTNAKLISKELGIRSSLVYYHFSSERELFEEMLKFIVMTNNALVTNELVKVKSEPAIKKALTYIQYNLEWGRTNPGQVAVLINGILSGSHDPKLQRAIQFAFEAGEQKVYGFLLEVFAEQDLKISKKQSEEAAATIHQALIGSILHQHAFPQSTSGNYLPRLKTLLLQTLGPSKESKD